MFYISSRGSSATTWVAQILNIFPGIVCFNSSRSFPPVDPGKTYPIHNWVKEISPEKFIESLIIAESSCRFKVKFGSIHGYHGTLAKKSCEEENGNFFYITRNPLERIHSVFILNLYNGIYHNKINNEKIFDRVVSLFKKNEKIEDYKFNSPKTLYIKNNKIYKKFYQKFIRNNDFLYEKIRNFKQSRKILNKLNNSWDDKNEKTYVLKLFKELCDDFFYKEKQLLNECNDNQGLKMEELVTSKHYFFENLLKKIDNENSLKNKTILDSINFNDFERVGIHRKIPINSLEIWKNLPQIMQDIYKESFNRNRINILCKKFDYDYSFLS